MADALDGEDLRVAARGEQQQIGKLQPPVEARNQRVALQMIDGEERLVGRDGDPLARRQTHQHAPDQPRPRRRRDSVEISGLDLRLLQRAADQFVEHLDMCARGDLRDDAAIGRMGRDLAHDLVGEDFAGAVGTQPHHRRSRFVTGGLQSQNPHGAYRIP